jgi:hypothetical protein
MTDTPKLTWKGRVIAFGVSALMCAAIIEGFARFVERKEDKRSVKQSIVEMKATLQPYMMFVTMTDEPIWRNIINHTEIHSKMTFNNLGFTGVGDFSVPPTAEFIGRYAAKPGEKLVLITGGSVIHGVGATSNENTIAGQLEVTLNARQSTYKYRVLNLGMGSWIAYQQFLGLSLFGLTLKPDWIVTMDGHNDASMTCAHGAGVGNPQNWPMLLYLTGGGTGVGRQSPLMRWLMQNTAIARVVTGAKPEERTSQLDRIYFDETEPDKRFLVKLRDVKVSDLDKQVDFYLFSQRNVMELFSSANILFSSQPILYNNAVSAWYRKAFGLNEERTADDAAADKERLKTDLDNFMQENGKTRCGSAVGSQALGYFMARSALSMEKAASEWAAESTNRSIRYSNVETIFPSGIKLRAANFIDNAHLNDLGQNAVAEFFAGYILETDLKIPVDTPAFVRSLAAKAAKAASEIAPKYEYSPPPQTPTESMADRRILEGLTAKKLSPGALELSETKNVGFHRILWLNKPVTPGKNATLTVDVWSDTVSVVRLEVLDNLKTYGRADFDLETKKVVAKDGNKVDAQIEDLAKGWRRIALILPVVGDTATITLALVSDTAVHYLGGGGSIVIAQPEEIEPVKYAYSPPARPQIEPIGGKRILEGLTAKERPPGALELDETGSAGFHRVIWTNVPVTPGKDTTLTVDVWSESADVVRLEMIDNLKTYGRADFDIVRQKVVAKDGKKVDAQIQDLGKGWKRITLTLPVAGGAATPSLALIHNTEVQYPGSSRSIVITEPALAPK